MAKHDRFKKYKKAKEERKRRVLIPEETKRVVLGVLMILIAVLIVLAFFDKAGMAGRGFMKTILFLFGRAGFILPLLFIGGGIAFFNLTYGYKSLIIAGLIVLIIGITGVLGILDFQKEAVLNTRQGGWTGFLISWPLSKLFGFWASLIIFSAITVIGGLILWHPLHQRKKRIAQERKEEKPSLIKKIFGPKFKIKEIEPIVVSPSEIQKEEISPKAKDLKNKDFERLAINLKKRAGSYPPIPLELLESESGSPTGGDLKTNTAIIKRTLENFDIPVEMTEVNVGPTVTQYTLKPAEGIKLSKITTLNNDLSLALAAHPIRIEAPIPGRSLVGIEVPNKGRVWVRLRNLIENPNFQDSSSHLTLVLGRDVSGKPVFAELSKMPHLLLAGSTGSGKTIGLNSIILSLLYKNSPQTLRFILVDPKRVEFSVYKNLPHLLCPVIYDAQKTVNALKWLIGEMERRFDILSVSGARNIRNYNEKALTKGTEYLPYIILMVDELADLMAARGREIEAGVVRLAQMARAVGIYLVLATQRPSVEVVTGLIKANITSRITYQVASQVDSRTVLDMAGAEKLLGNGDLLFISAEIVKPKRIQGAYVSEQEVRKVVDFIKNNWQAPESLPLEEITDSKAVSDLEQVLESESREGVFYRSGEEADDLLYEEAKKMVIEAKKASASLLQRRLRIGYARAARLLDILEEKGIVGPSEGAKPREVYVEGLANEQFGDSQPDMDNEKKSDPNSDINSDTNNNINNKEENNKHD